MAHPIKDELLRRLRVAFPTTDHERLTELAGQMAPAFTHDGERLVPLTGLAARNAQKVAPHVAREIANEYTEAHGQGVSPSRRTDLQLQGMGIDPATAFDDDETDNTFAGLDLSNLPGAA